MINYSDVQIGGVNIIVEVDETKLGKRKYNRGHRVEGVWVIGGVERTMAKKIFFQEVQDRSYETIKRIFQLYIKPGSIIHTDGWAPYVKVCEELGFEHHVVNHKYNFKDPITGTHTNTIEGNNNGLKTLIKPRNRVEENINDWLFYFLWRRVYKGKFWCAFIDSLKEISY
jgi:IS1 family transposase